MLQLLDGYRLVYRLSPTDYLL